MDHLQNLILVIFGASGDLTRLKLIPAVYRLHQQGLLPEGFAVLGIGRSQMTNEQFRENVNCAIVDKNQQPEDQPKRTDNFCKKLSYLSIDTSDYNAYDLVKQKLGKLDQQLNIQGNYMFYLATPPSLYKTIAKGLCKTGLNDQTNGWKRIIVEKPFGYDLDSAVELNQYLLNIFKEDQVYRIDHYLGKETVQNVLVTRFSNGFFEPIWNRRYVDYVEISSIESLGINQRGGYYENAGALRDMVQNHLLQLVSLVAMEPPAFFDSNSIRNETVKVLHSLRPFQVSNIDKFVVRGQYTESKTGSEIAYLSEDNVAADSKTETYVAMKFFIDNWRWGGVPFYIRTGKRLKSKATEIVLHLKPAPHQLFNDPSNQRGGNQLIIRIQPDEGIALDFGMKIPGAGFKVQDANLHFHYKDLPFAKISEAYERLLVDCMMGDSTLYARDDAVEASWKFIMPILEAWKNNPELPLYKYESGSWGPDASCLLFDRPDIQWRHPCSSFSLNGTCDL
jgi:glucose-6-phosphate 1-dehydrogenase